MVRRKASAATSDDTLAEVGWALSYLTHAQEAYMAYLAQSGALAVLASLLNRSSHTHTCTLTRERGGKRAVPCERVYERGVPWRRDARGGGLWGVGRDCREPPAPIRNASLRRVRAILVGLRPPVRRDSAL